MSDETAQVDQYFLQLLYSLQAGAMQQMGKIASPMTGKLERDLAMAQHTISILEMLDKKTKGNLSEDEAKLIGHILYELRLNYVDESKKGENQPETEEKSESPSDTNSADDEKKPE